jgi:hypothetical protein
MNGKCHLLAFMNLNLSKLPLLLVASATTVFGQVLLQDNFDFLGSKIGSDPDASNISVTTDGSQSYFDVDTTGFSAAGHDKLVLSYTTKSEFNIAGGQDSGGKPFSSISFNGQSLTEIQTIDNSNRATGGMWYLDNVITDGTLRLVIDSASSSQAITHFGVGLYALDGTKLGFQDSATGSDDIASTVSVTTSSAFVLQDAARNNQSLTAVGDDDWVTNFDYSNDSYEALQQYQITTATGDYFAPTGNGATKLVMGASFEAVPEPSAVFLIGGLGILVLLRRRR